MDASLKHQAWADIAVFEDLNDGKMLEAFFREKGIEARTYDDKFFRYLLFLRPPRITYRVQVRHSQVADADEFLRVNPPMVLEKAFHCPACSSLRISYPQMRKKFLTPTLVLHLGIIFRLVDHECYCEDCHEVWNLPRR